LIDETDPNSNDAEPEQGEERRAKRGGERAHASRCSKRRATWRLRGAYVALTWRPGGARLRQAGPGRPPARVDCFNASSSSLLPTASTCGAGPGTRPPRARGT
jgi:hypothetical protein